MTNKRMSIDNEKFWKILCSLESLTSEIGLYRFMAKYDFDESDVLKGIKYLNNLNFSIELVKKASSDLMISPPTHKTEINCKFSVSELLAFQALYPRLESFDKLPYYETILKKLLQLEKSAAEYDLMESEMVYQTDKAIELMSGKTTFKIPFLEEINHAIAHKNHLDIVFAFNDKETESMIYPHMLVYFESELVLVAEDCNEQCMIIVRLMDVLKIISESAGLRPLFSTYEVNEFFDAIRHHEGHAIRLVLKIENIEGFDFHPHYHHLGNPFVASNASGEVIWAATVDPCEEIYNWLYSMRDCLEVLGPEEFKKDFARFSSEKNK